MNESLRNILEEEFKDKEVRDVYCGEFLNSSIATQIKVLREQRSLTQADLAELAGMKQSRIATIEDVNYSSWSINTLRRIAEAFDLALTVQFDSFGYKLFDIVNLSRESLERPSFNDDPVFQEELGAGPITISGNILITPAFNDVEIGHLETGDDIQERLLGYTVQIPFDSGMPTISDQLNNIPIRLTA